MQTIHKFKLDDEREMIRLPLGARVLSAKVQRGRAVVYALVDTAITETEDYEFVTVSTGEDAEVYADGIVNYTFLDTLLFGDNHAFISHIFYRKFWKVVNP
ncbi:DUF7352 domain-containing protein [Paenibacillus agilis]|uniref:DUF7352 domain-containing protein n=1 Tax=Paenibacillus agilis TaxID=3020863 RepID=A0A559IE98_9BACL|nr:hypothetical protein [Paenibacillus agilis]TVX85982.1 hypothetical protein FPZ44_23825 [Paenibacillus agilis]